MKLGLVAEASTFNLQHVTVVHIHNADPSTPRKMLKALPKVPPVLKLTLKNFYNTEASAGAGAPWWFDLGIVKSGQGYTDMMAYNTVATAALTPLARRAAAARDGAGVRQDGRRGARSSSRTVGVSGVNVIKDGKETASHNPHNTLVYSMTKYDARIQAAMKEVADEIEPNPAERHRHAFTDVSIVEIGFTGQRAAGVLPDQPRGRLGLGRERAGSREVRAELAPSRLRRSGRRGRRRRPCRRPSPP